MGGSAEEISFCIMSRNAKYNTARDVQTSVCSWMADGEGQQLLAKSRRKKKQIPELVLLRLSLLRQGCRVICDSTAKVQHLEILKTLPSFKKNFSKQVSQER